MRGEIKDRIKKAVKLLCEYQKENLSLRQSANIYLGRMFSLGAQCQYFLAKELFDNTRYDVLVDCAVTFNRKGKSTTLYPDILVIEEKKTLKGIIDVKLDLGWVDPDEFGFKIKKGGNFAYNADKNTFLKKYKDFLNAEVFKYKHKNEDGDIECEPEIKIPKRLFKAAIVLMGNVNHHDRYDGYKHAMKDAGFRFLHILSDGNVRHPKDEKNMQRIFSEIEENGDLEQIFQLLFEQNAPIDNSSGSENKNYESHNSNYYKIGRDYSKYDFDGKIHSKNRLVLEVVRKYLREHPYTTYADLLEIFPDSLHSSSYGVFRKVSTAKQVEKGGYRRYFTYPDEVLKTADGIQIAVCNQWGAETFDQFVDYVRGRLQYRVDTIEATSKNIVF